MDLPTYTSIWRIEKRLYKLYDFRLPMPLPIGQVTVFAAVAVPYVVILQLLGLPFNHTLIWLYILPPGVVTWLVTRPVLESKRLPELVRSQLRYLAEPKVICRMAPLAERDVVLVTGRVWRPRTRRAGSTAAAGVLAASVRDGTVPDAELLDAEVPGGAGLDVLDADVLDADVQDAGEVGVGVSDAEVPDAEVPDAEVPDAEMPDAELVEVDWPDAEVPDGEVLDAEVPDAEVLDGGGRAGHGSSPGAAEQTVAWAAAPVLDEEAAAAPLARGRTARQFRGLPTRSWWVGQPSGRSVAEHPAKRAQPDADAPVERGDRAGQAGEKAPTPQAVDQRVEASRAVEPGAMKSAAARTAGAAQRASGTGPAAATQRASGIGSAGAGQASSGIGSAGATQASSGIGSARPDGPVTRGEQGSAARAASRPAWPLSSWESVSAAVSVSAVRPERAGSPETGTGKRPESMTKPAAGPEPDAAAGPEPEAASPEPQAAAGPEPQAAAGPEPDAVAGPEPEGPEPDAVAGPEPDAAAGPEPEAAAGPEPEAGVGAAPDAATGPEPEAATGSPDEGGAGSGSVGQAGQSAADAEVVQTASPEVPAGLAMPARALSAGAGADDPGSRAVAAGPVAPGPVAPGAPVSQQATLEATAEPEGPDEPGPPAPAASSEAAPAPETEPQPGAAPSTEDTTPAGPTASPQRPQITVVNHGSAHSAPPAVERALAGPSARRGDVRAGRVAVVPGGHRPGKPDLLQRDRARARRPIGGPARVVVLGCTVGAGQTMTTLLTGDVLVSLRSDRIAVLDLNPGSGSLARRAEARPALGSAASLSPPGLAVIAPPRPGAHGPFGGAQNGPRADAELAFAAATDRYDLVLADPATVAVPRLLGLADQLVLVAPASGAAPGAVAMTFEWLEAHGKADLAAGAIMVLNGVSRRSIAQVEQAERVCAGRCRATVRVPWDEQVQQRLPQQRMPTPGEGPQARQHWAGVMSPATAAAFTALAGVLVASLAERAERAEQSGQPGVTQARAGAGAGHEPAELGQVPR